MIENLKQVLLKRLNTEVEEYNKLKEKYEKMAEKIKDDNSDIEYDYKKKELKKEYGMKRFSKKQEYMEKLKEIEEEYSENLKSFRVFYDEYLDVKRQLSKWNIYETRKKIKEISKYKTLKDFHMSREKIEELIDEGQLEDTLTEDDYKMLNKLR